MLKKLIEKIKEKKEEFKEKKNLKEFEKAKAELGKKEELKKLEESKEEKPKGLTSQIKELNEKMDIISQKEKSEKKLKKKKFKIPFRVKSQLKKLAMKGKVQVMLLQGTRGIKPVIGELRDGMLLVKGMVYNGSVDSTWLWNGKYPTMIVPEWDLQPITPDTIEEMKKTSTMSAQDLANYCLKFGRSAVPGKIILRAIEAKQNLMLKAGRGSMKGYILAIIVTIIIMAVLFGGKIV